MADQNDINIGDYVHVFTSPDDDYGIWEVVGKIFGIDEKWYGAWKCKYIKNSKVVVDRTDKVFHSCWMTRIEQKQECTCKIEILLMYGCKCGQMEREKLVK